jgi:hypothetical protein
VRSQWIRRYLTYFKRCADIDGLAWWVSEYNGKRDCQGTNGVYSHAGHGHNTEESCWDHTFQLGGVASGDWTNPGHVTSTVETVLCGEHAYPWPDPSARLSDNSFAGTRCKYRP